MALVKTIKLHNLMNTNNLPSPTNYGEEKYITACYGNISDSPLHIMRKGAQDLEVFTREIEPMMLDGWESIGVKK